MENKAPDEILYDKIRNYCLDPWKSTRTDVPPYGVPVLMAWHHDRTENVAELEGFLGYSFGIGARYYYEEIKDDNNITVTVCSHLSEGKGIPIDNFRVLDEAYRIGMSARSWVSYDNRSQYKNIFGLKDPYLEDKKEEDKKHIRYDYWVNFSEGKFGSKFKNLHAADLSFIPEKTINKVLNDGENHIFRFQHLTINAEECTLSGIPDYWMQIPKLK
jgi:hypothetical protein